MELITKGALLAALSLAIHGYISLTDDNLIWQELDELLAIEL